MAKHQAKPALEQLIKELGYEVDATTHPHDAGRLYSDLYPVPEDLYEKTERELEAYKAAENGTERLTLGDKVLEDGVSIHENGPVGCLRFSVDVTPTPEVFIPFIMSQDEVLHLTSTMKQLVSENPDTSIGSLSKLPAEIRERVFEFAVPSGVWEIEDTEVFHQRTFIGLLGSSSGFYFPLGSPIGILSVNRQIRRESLPLAFRCTAFRFDDMDDLIKFLLSIGRIGRENIETLDFPWESTSDTTRRWAQFPGQDVTLQLPLLHVQACIGLLKQCRRLRLMRIQISAAVLQSLSVEEFRNNSGITALCSLQPIKKVVIYDPFDEDVGVHSHAVWLREELERSDVPRDLNQTDSVDKKPK